MRARLRLFAALAALAVAGTALTGLSAPATAAPAPAAAAQSAPTTTAPQSMRATAESGMTTATAYRAKGIRIRVAHKRISRAQLAKHGMKVTVTGLRKRTKVYIAAGLPNTNEPVLWSKTARASRSGKVTLRLTYLTRAYDRRGKRLSRGRYMVGVMPYSGSSPLFHNAFRVY